MDLWYAGGRFLGAVISDGLRLTWRFLAPGLRAVGACWCAGYTTTERRTDTSRKPLAWPRTREALVGWRAARGLTKIDRFLESQPGVRQPD